MDSEHVPETAAGKPHAACAFDKIIMKEKNEVQRLVNLLFYSRRHGVTEKTSPFTAKALTARPDQQRLSNREEDVKQIQLSDDFFSAVRMSDGNVGRAARIMRREKKRRPNAGAF